MGSTDGVLLSSVEDMRRSERPPASRCDVVLLTWNRRDLLEPCVERLVRYTRRADRLIIVDNGSADPEALAYLNRLASGGPGEIKIEVVRLPENRSIATALNAGLALATAPWICLLNNDVLVTAGWLDEMLDVAERGQDIGLVNPMSNEFNCKPQRSGETIDDLARRLQARRGQWVEHWMGVGFCLVLSQRVLRRIGMMDEGFRGGYFEDADYSLRVQRAGLRCVIAEAAYVYHHGSATMRHDPGRSRLFQENEARFLAKWSKEPPRRIAWVLTGSTTKPLGEPATKGRACGVSGQPVNGGQAQQRHAYIAGEDDPLIRRPEAEAAQHGL